MRTLTTATIRAAAELFSGRGLAVRVKGMEDWIDQSLRGAATIEVDCGSTPHGKSRLLHLREGDQAPETAEEAGAMVDAMLATHAAAGRRIAGNLAAERDNQR